MVMWKTLMSMAWLSGSMPSMMGIAPPGYLGWKLGWEPAPTNLTDSLAARGLTNLAIFNRRKGDNQEDDSCSTPEVRREWSTLLPSERKAYTDAVTCLMSKPSRFGRRKSSLAPGAKSRFDDFAAIHINSTLSIHLTANFLSWHRLFTWTYEQALRKECGFEGTQPYWNWAKTAFDPLNSPMFDGSPFSMSGNGVFEPHNCTNAIGSTAIPPLNCIPPGAGGGCVESGPFKDHIVNLAPVFPQLAEKELNGSLPLLSYAPRCLKRDISSWVSSNWTKDVDVAGLITKNSDINSFQTMMQGNNFTDGFYGVHAGGHYTIGGDPGGDFFASPGDPAFFLHHAQLDRTWWIWQNQDLKNRQNAIAGTITIGNSPPSRNGTLDDWLDLGVLGTSTEIRNVMSTTRGKLCYIYV